jgi:hypothetical protein
MESGPSNGTNFKIFLQTPLAGPSSAPNITNNAALKNTLPVISNHFGGKVLTGAITTHCKFF